VQGMWCKGSSLQGLVGGPLQLPCSPGQITRPRSVGGRMKRSQVAGGPGEGGQGCSFELREAEGAPQPPDSRAAGPGAAAAHEFSCSSLVRR
jgi:hypothetical protein